MLSACTAGAVGVYPQIIILDLNVHILLNIRHHIAGHKGSLPFSRRIEG